MPAAPRRPVRKSRNIGSRYSENTLWIFRQRKMPNALHCLKFHAGNFRRRRHLHRARIIVRAGQREQPALIRIYFSGPLPRVPLAQIKRDIPMEHRGPACPSCPVICSRHFAGLCGADRLRIHSGTNSAWFTAGCAAHGFWRWRTRSQAIIAENASGCRYASSKQISARPLQSACPTPPPPRTR